MRASSPLMHEMDLKAVTLEPQKNNQHFLHPADKQNIMNLKYTSHKKQKYEGTAHSLKKKERGRFVEKRIT